MVKKIFTFEKVLNKKSPYHTSDKSLYFRQEKPFLK